MGAGGARPMLGTGGARGAGVVSNSSAAPPAARGGAGNVADSTGWPRLPGQPQQDADGFTPVPPSRWNRRHAGGGGGGAEGDDMAVEGEPAGGSTCATGVTDSVCGASGGALAEGPSEDDSDSPADVLFARMRDQRALARSLKQQGVAAAIIRTAEDTADATERKWHRARPPPRASQKLRRAEDAYARACSSLAAADREIKELEERTARERSRLAQRRVNAQASVASKREHLDRTRREVGGGAPLPPTDAPPNATCDLAGVHRAHVAIDTEIGPELVSLLDLAEEGSELHGRMAAAVARLNDAATTLGVSTAVGIAASCPRTYHIGEGDGGGGSEDGQELSSLDDSDNETDPEPEDRQPHAPPGSAEPAAPTPVASPAPPPGGSPPPVAGGVAADASGVHMADSTKRGLPEDDGGAQWAPTGSAPHGAGAWRRGAGGADDEEQELRPRGKGRRTTSATEGDGSAGAGAGGAVIVVDADRVHRQRAIEQQIEELRAQHAQLAQQQQQRAASGADPAADAAAAADHQRLEAAASAVAEERRRLRVAELRSLAITNGAVLPPNFDHLGWEQLQSWAAVSLPAAPLS